MENSAGVVVRRSTEGRKFVATAMDMVQERVNKSTRDTEAVVFVQDERSRTVRKREGEKDREIERNIYIDRGRSANNKAKAYFLC